MQNSLINNISGKNQLKFQFFMCGAVGHQGTVASDGCTKFFLCSNKIARLFYHQTIWKKSIGILVFLHRESLQGTLISETTTFGWVWPGVPLVQLNCRIFRSAISVEGNKWCPIFFAWRCLSREGTIWDYHFVLGGPCVSFV